MSDSDACTTAQWPAYWFTPDPDEQFEPGGEVVVLVDLTRANRPRLGVRGRRIPMPVEVLKRLVSAGRLSRKSLTQGERQP